MSSGRYVYVASSAANTSADLLKRAATIRQHAWHFVDDPIVEGLEKYADDLEAQAARLARA